MRLRVFIFAIACASLALARERGELEELKSRVETAAPKERVGMALKIAELQTKAADKLYADGKSEEAQAALHDIVTYSQKAADAASESGKKLKDAEITVRKIAHKLSDVKRSVNFEDQTPIQDAIDRLEHLRTQLLSKMFDLGIGAQ